MWKPLQVSCVLTFLNVYIYVCHEFYKNFSHYLTHLKRPWCWETLRAGGEGNNRGWDSGMVSPTQWTRVWVDSGGWWWTGRPGVLGFMGLQRVGHDWVTKLNWTELSKYCLCSISLFSPLNSWWNVRPFHSTWKKSESEVAQLCLTLCDPIDCSLPGSSIHGIFQTTVLEWVAISFSRRSSQPRDWTQVSCTAGRRFTVWATREALVLHDLSLNLFFSCISFPCLSVSYSG